MYAGGSAYGVGMRDPTFFTGVDLDTFWEDDDYARDAWIEDPPTPATIAAVQAELGYELPASYVALMSHHNGGTPVNTCCPAPGPTTWAEDHVGVSGIMGIGS